MSPEEFLNEFGHLAETEGGVSSLREITTTLALEGQLSLANPRDGSAAGLLRAVWSKLEENLTARQLAVLRPEPAASEAMCSTPEHWEWERLGRLGEVVGGVTKGRKLGGRETKAFPYLRVANVQRGFLQLDEIKVIEIPLDELEKYVLKEGDVLLTEGGDWDKLGRACIWNAELPVCLHQNHVFRVRPVGRDGLAMLPRWLELYCNAPPGKMYFQKAAKRTTNLASINMNQLRNCPVPVPPLPEQKRIVEKVDQLMALCDELEAKQKQKLQMAVSLNKAALSAVVHAPNKSKLKSSWSRVQDHFEVLYELPENVKELRQAILQLAVRGKLVPQRWERKVTQEHLSALREAKTVALSEGRIRDGGETHSKAPTSPPFEVPGSWEWVRFRDMVWCYRGHNPPKDVFVDTSRPGYVRFVQITDFKTDAKAVYVPDSPQLKKLKRGEIAMAAYRHIGKVSRDVEGAFNVAICKVMEIPPASRDFVEFLIGTEVVRGELLGASERGHIPSMHSDHLLSLLVPCPPPEEQKQIVQRVAELMVHCDHLEAMLAQHRDQGQRLMQAVVESLVA